MVADFRARVATIANKTVRVSVPRCGPQKKRFAAQLLCTARFALSNRQLAILRQWYGLCFLERTFSRLLNLLVIPASSSCFLKTRFSWKFRQNLLSANYSVPGKGANCLHKQHSVNSLNCAPWKFSHRHGVRRRDE